MIKVHVPLKKLSKKQTKSQRKPWITVEIKKSISNRDNLLKKYLKAKGERRTTLYSQYKQLRNQIVNMIRESKSNYYHEFFNNNLKNSKKYGQVLTI